MLSVVKRKVSFIYAHMSTLHTHTHTHLKDYKAVWQNPQTLNTPPLLENLEVFYFIFVQNSSIGQQLSQHSQHYTPLMELHYSNSCQQFSAYIYSTHVLTSNRFLVYPLSVLPSVPTSHLETNTRHHAKQDVVNQTWYHLHLRATSFHNYTEYHKTARGMSSLKTSF